MKSYVKVMQILTITSLFFLLGARGAFAADQAFTSHTVEIDGVKLHYTSGGHGPALILLHGYAETSRM